MKFLSRVCESFIEIVLFLVFLNQGYFSLNKSNLEDTIIGNNSFLITLLFILGFTLATSVYLQKNNKSINLLLKCFRVVINTAYAVISFLIALFIYLFFYQGFSIDNLKDFQILLYFISPLIITIAVFDITSNFILKKDEKTQ